MSGSPPQILVVDDDDEIRSLLQVVLTREGFRVQEAKDAPTARRMLAAQGSVELICPARTDFRFASACARLRRRRSSWFRRAG